MQSQVVNSRLIYLDSELQQSSGRTRINLPSSAFTVTGARDRMSLSLMQFGYRRQHYNVNATNNVFFYYDAVADTYTKLTIPAGAYYDLDELASAVQVAIRAVLATATCVYSDSTRKFTFNLIGADAAAYLVSFQSKTGGPATVSAQDSYVDTHELLGTIPSRTNAPVSATGLVGPGEHVCPFPASLNTLEAVYLRCTSHNGGNFESVGHAGRNVPDQDQIIESNIMARIPMQYTSFNDNPVASAFISYQDQGNDLFTMHMDRKNLNQLEFYLSDDKGRPLTPVGTGQNALGLLSFNAVLKWTHLRDTPLESGYTPKILQPQMPSI